MYKTKCPCCGYKYLIECGEVDGDNVGEIITNMHCCKCECDLIITIRKEFLNEESER